MSAYLTGEIPRRSYKSAQLPYATRHERFPIPSIQIELSRVGGDNRLVQNQGY
jgi:hypothetical protein